MFGLSTSFGYLLPYFFSSANSKASSNSFFLFLVVILIPGPIPSPSFINVESRFWSFCFDQHSLIFFPLSKTDELEPFYHSLDLNFLFPFILIQGLNDLWFLLFFFQCNGVDENSRDLSVNCHTQIWKNLGRVRISLLLLFPSGWVL